METTQRTEQVAHFMIRGALRRATLQAFGNQKTTEDHKTPLETREYGYGPV